MDILTPFPTINKEALERAEEVITLTNAQGANLLSSWQRGIDKIWASDDPQEVLDALERRGVSTVRLFQLSAKTVEFLEFVSPGCTASGRDMIRPFEVVDGKIKLKKF